MAENRPLSRGSSIRMRNSGGSSGLGLEAIFKAGSLGSLPAPDGRGQRLSARRGSVVSNYSVEGIERLYVMQKHGTLTGPLLPQTLVMYAFFIFVVTSAEVFDWAPQVRIIAFVPYASVCLVLLETCRLAQLSDSVFSTLYPFYSTLFPFALILFFSREAHLLVSLLYFCSTMIIYLQSGLDNLQLYLMIYMIIFIGFYTLLVVAMTVYYIDSKGTSLIFGRILDPPIYWGQEVTFIISLALIGIAFLLLEKFIRLYGMALVQRVQQIESLEVERDLLKEELSAFQKDEMNVDLDAPIQKVIATLTAISSETDDTGVRNEILEIIKTLSSNKLYSPDLNFSEKPQVDTEVSSWLHNMLNQTDSHLKVADTTKTNITEKSITKVTRFLPVMDGDAEAKVNILMDTLEQWDTDIFHINEITGGRPLFFTCYALFNRHDLFNKFSINEAKFRRWLTLIEDGYRRENPYHNSIHAADVLQCVNWFITVGTLSRYLSDLDILAALLAAVIHDFEHPGLNNQFHINTQSKLAVRYNDKSVLENHHACSAFSLLYEDQNNLFSGLSEEQFKQVREEVVSMVLATDMAQHFEILGHFKSRTQDQDSFESKELKDRILLLSIAIKCADISNPARLARLCDLWAGRVMEEFYRQGDEERRLGLTVSAFMDRTKPAEAKCQLGFLDFIVFPLFEAWTNFLNSEGCGDIITNLEANHTMWKSRQEQADRRESIAKQNTSLECLVLDGSASDLDKISESDDR